MSNVISCRGEVFETATVEVELDARSTRSWKVVYRDDSAMFISMRVVHWILLVLAAFGCAVVVLGTRSTHPLWPLTRTIGTCLLCFVLAWVVVARIQLGRAFSVTPQARQLVTTGLYRRIRNPIYFASPFLLIGLSLVLAQWWPLLLLVVVIPLQIVRARREEAVLRAAFGAEYDQYRARTWF